MATRQDLFDDEDEYVPQTKTDDVVVPPATDSTTQPSEAVVEPAQTYNEGDYQNYDYQQQEQNYDQQQAYNYDQQQ